MCGARTLKRVDRRGVAAGDRGRARLARRRAARPRHCSPRRCAPPPADGGRATARIAPATARANRRASPRPAVAAVDRRFCRTRSRISPQMTSGVWNMRSSVRPTAPSVEFSTGTTAWSVCAALRRAEHVVDRRARLHVDGLARNASPRLRAKTFPAARDRRRAASARARGTPTSPARKMPATASFGSGPVFADCRRASTCASRSGRYAAPPLLSAPIACACAARALRRSRISRSSASMAARWRAEFRVAVVGGRHGRRDLST